MYNSKEVRFETKGGKVFTANVEFVNTYEAVPELEKLLLEDLTEESRERVKQALKLLFN